MLITSDHLGEIDVPEDSLVDIPDGILGFPGITRFAIVAAEETGVYAWLQAVDEPDLSFLVVVPAAFFPEYEPEIPDEDCAALGLVDPADAQLLCLVSIMEASVTANLLGPVVLNVPARVARQVVLADTGLATAEPIRPQL